MSNQSTFSFLGDVPAEIRLEIYGYMAIPSSTSFYAYAGLYLSCRQIKQEMDDKCGKVLGAHLHGIKDALPTDSGIRLTIASSATSQTIPFAQMLEAKVSLSTRCFFDGSTVLFYRVLGVSIPFPKAYPGDLEPLLNLHLRTLAIKFHKEATETDSNFEEHITRLHAAHLLWFAKTLLERPGHAQTIVIELGPLREDAAQTWMTIGFAPPHGWMMQCVVEPGRPVQLRFDRGMASPHTQGVEYGRNDLLRALHGGRAENEGDE